MISKWQTTRLLHGVRAIVGGQGPPVILIPGWPQTAEAFSDIFEPLSKHYQFFALDPPGLGDSPAPLDGYDTANVSKVMAEAVYDCLKDKPYHLVGHDVGGWIAYPWAAQFQSRIKSLSILDASVPGFLPKFEFPLSRQTNLRLWQFSFNALPELPEILTTGRERELLTWFFNLKTVHPEELPKDQFERYIQAYSRPGAMSRGFEYYRAFETSAKQNLEFAKTPLDIPVLALGGASSVGSGMIQLVQNFAAQVSGGAIEDCGHFLPEEQPSAVVERVLEFLEANETEKVKNTADILPFFYLLNLQHVSASIENPGKWAWPGPHAPVPPKLKSLDLTNIREGYLGEILAVTKSLQTLRWKWYYDLGVEDDFITQTVDLDQIATALSHVQGTLTNLAITADCQPAAAVGDQFFPGLEAVGSLIALVKFDRIKTLHIPLAFLVGFAQDRTKRLQDVIPRNFEFLNITDDLALQNMDNMEEQWPAWEWKEYAILGLLESWLREWTRWTPYLIRITLLLSWIDTDTNQWSPGARE